MNAFSYSSGRLLKLGLSFVDKCIQKKLIIRASSRKYVCNGYYSSADCKYCFQIKFNIKNCLQKC